MLRLHLFLLLFCLQSFVNTTVLDVRYPQFFHQSSNDSSVEILEGKSAGSFIAFINLINDTNTLINEWIFNTTDRDFTVQTNGMSYSLMTTQTLDRERKDFYQFSIRAQRLVPPYDQISKDIRIRILDLNDCPPIFNQTIYQTEMIPGETIYTINAFDADEPNTDNSRISYSLSNYQNLFRINETTGAIQYINHRPTSHERYELIVVARDHGIPSLSSSALVQIQLVSSLSSRKPAPSSPSSWLNIEQNPQNILILAGILAALFVFISLFICLVCCLNYKIKRRKEQTCLTTTKNDEKKNKYDYHHHSSNSSTSSTNDLQQQQQTANGQFTRINDERATILYDAMNVFPNTYYLPLKQQPELIENLNNSNNNDTSLHLPPSSSTTSSPVSATDGTGCPGIVRSIGSDDGCYCSSDMSSEQSNVGGGGGGLLLLNPSSLSSSSKLPGTTSISCKHVRFCEKTNHTDGALKRFENLYGSQTSTTNHCASYV